MEAATGAGATLYKFHRIGCAAPKNHEARIASNNDTGCGVKIFQK